MENILDAKSITYNEFDSKNNKKDVDFDILLNNKDQKTEGILKILEQNDNLKLIEIQANDYLNKIKKMIGKPLETKEHSKIDKDFIQSLKTMIVVKYGEIDNKYLKYLSYVYYAMCNNTMDVYNKLKQENNELEYYMLDKKYCNYIGYKMDWKKYQDNGRKELLREAYANDLLDELLEILNINDDFSLESSLDEKDIMENFFRKMINTFDMKMLAQSNLYVFIIAVACENQEMIEYLKNLYSINPNIDFSAKMFKKHELIIMLKDTFELEQVALLTKYQQYYVSDLYSLNSKKYVDLIKYFFEMIKANPDLILTYEGRYCIDKIVEFKLPIIPELLVQMDKEEHNKLYEILRLYEYNRGNVKFNLKYNKLIKELYAKYLEKEQYRVIKKEYKQNKNKRKI